MIDNGDISFSYRIITRRDPATTWSNRLDHYIKTGDNNIHLANIIYAACAAVTLVVTLLLVLERSLSRDFTKLEILKTSRRQMREHRRSGLNDGDEREALNANRPAISSENVQWKKLQGDVFRKPDYSFLLCVACGVGAQVLTILMITLVFFAIGIIRKESRAYFAFNCIVYLIFGGMANGYCTARAMKFFGAEEWRFAASAGSFSLPVFVGITFCLVDLIDWVEKSDQVLPFSSIMLYTFFWGCLNVPAVYAASWAGFMYSND